MIVANNKIVKTKNAGKSTMISMAMAVHRYDAGRIARWSTSRASLKGHGASVGTILPRWLPWLTNSNETHKTLTKHNFLLATTVHFDC